MDRLKLFLIGIAGVVALLAIAACDGGGDGDAVESRLDTVRDRGEVICASRNDVPGYGSIDSAGNNVGFDIDLCRALAAAVLGDPNAIEDPVDLRRRARADDPVGRGRHAGAHSHLDDLQGTPSGGTTPRRCSMTARDSWSGRT